MRLGPCEVLSPSGAGGIGEVYEAMDTRLDFWTVSKCQPSEVEMRRSDP
jgi:hypothetical protein